MKSTYFENDENLQIRVLDKPIVLDAAGGETKAVDKFILGTKCGSAGAFSVKAKAAISRLSVAEGVQAEVLLYDRLFADALPYAGCKDFLQSLNRYSLKVLTSLYGAVTGAGQSR